MELQPLNELQCKSVLKQSHDISNDNHKIDETTVKLKRDLSSDNNSHTHNSFVFPCEMENNSSDEHPAAPEDLIQEDFEEDKALDITDSEQLLRAQEKKGIVFVRRIPSTLLQPVVQDNFVSRQTPMLTTPNAKCSQTAIVEDNRNQLPIVKTIIVHQRHRQTQNACPSPSSLSLTQPDENKNSILLVKAPTTYVPLSATAITASKQQEQQDYEQQVQQNQPQLQTEIAYFDLTAQLTQHQPQQTVSDYRHHQQHDQRKALTKLFLPNKIHVKPISQQKQSQFATTNTTATNDISNESLSHVCIRNGSKNIVSKIKVLNLRKRFMTSTTHH